MTNRLTLTAAEIDKMAAYGPLKEQAKLAIELAQAVSVSGDEVLSSGGAQLPTREESFWDNAPSPSDAPPRQRYTATPLTDALQDKACDEREDSTLRHEDSGLYDMAQRHMQEGYDHARALERRLRVYEGRIRSPEQRQPRLIPVATILMADAFDERDGLWLSRADMQKLASLPPGTVLYVTSGTVVEQPSSKP